jgi:prophage regulatory protein
MNDRFIRFKELSQIIGLRRSAIYKAIKAGQLPAPYKIGARASAWKSSEIQSWIEQRQRAGGAR